MNGKQAKRLRRAALGLAATLNEAGKDIKKDGYEVKKHEKRNAVPQTRVDSTGVETSVPALPAYQLQVKAASLKGIYKKLKRHF